MIQWLRIHLPRQGTQVWSSVQEDSACPGHVSPRAATAKARKPWSPCHGKKNECEAPALLNMSDLPNCHTGLSPFLSKSHQDYFVDIDKSILKCWKRRTKWQNESLAPGWSQWTMTIKMGWQCHRARHIEWNRIENPETVLHKCARQTLAEVVALSQ